MGKLQGKVVITGEKLICSLPVQSSRCVDEPNGSQWSGMARLRHSCILMTAKARKACLWLLRFESAKIALTPRE
jgi:hypothetical protein